MGQRNKTRGAKGESVYVRPSQIFISGVKSDAAGEATPTALAEMAARIAEIKSGDELPLAPAFRARTDIIDELTGYGYSDAELFDLVVPKRTLARRRSDDELLTVEETDKALRLKRIAALAQKVFGNPAKAYRWLRKPKLSLTGDTPLAYLASENGARIVEEMLGRIEHGIYA